MRFEKLSALCSFRVDTSTLRRAYKMATARATTLAGYCREALVRAIEDDELALDLQKMDADELETGGSDAER